MDTKRSFFDIVAVIGYGLGIVGIFVLIWMWGGEGTRTFTLSFSHNPPAAIDRPADIAPTGSPSPSLSETTEQLPMEPPLVVITDKQNPATTLGVEVYGFCSWAHTANLFKEGSDEPLVPGPNGYTLESGAKYVFRAGDFGGCPKPEAVQPARLPDTGGGAGN